MRNPLLAATAAIALLGGCDQAPVEQPANTVVADNSPVLPVRDNAAVLVRPPANKQAALKLMHERHERMEEIGDAFKLLGREVKAGAPDLAAVRSSAATIATLAPKASAWFPPGTGPDVGKTRAKAEIWQKPEDYAAKTRAFQAAARAFNATAKAGDAEAIQAGFATLGKTCKACHDPYRAEKH